LLVFDSLSISHHSTPYLLYHLVDIHFLILILVIHSYHTPGI
jgi:hypothetical protein